MMQNVIAGDARHIEPVAYLRYRRQIVLAIKANLVMTECESA